MYIILNTETYIISKSQKEKKTFEFYNLKYECKLPHQYNQLKLYLDLVKKFVEEVDFLELQLNEIEFHFQSL